MKVRAKALGYYGLKRQREGDEFVLTAVVKDGKVVLTPEAQFSPKWMEKVEDEEVKASEEPAKDEPKVSKKASEKPKKSGGKKKAKDDEVI